RQAVGRHHAGVSAADHDDIGVFSHGLSFFKVRPQDTARPAVCDISESDHSSSAESSTCSACWSCSTPAFKTLHVLTFVDDPAYRLEMKAMRNLEGRHDLARHIFHGRKGELHRVYRDGQEDQLGALGLVLNCVTLWNTVYLDRAVAELRALGYPVLEEDVARLSAYVRRHINVHGHYSFGYPTSAAPGGRCAIPTTPTRTRTTESDHRHRGVGGYSCCSTIAAATSRPTANRVPIPSAATVSWSLARARLVVMCSALGSSGRRTVHTSTSSLSASAVPAAAAITPRSTGSRSATSPRSATSRIDR
ncbi:Tn3 family transposase, partial [Micromonospora coerulea]|uniref:Tn3 family transposase n=1 Tax=Micromonospora coerulea TaxID=47856 RepID=UPI0031F97663